MHRSSTNSGDRRRQSAETIARGLGWFSLGLGIAELLMPRVVARVAGLQGREELVQAYGLREVATGLGLLSSDNPTPWVWARVGGDALDIGTLGANAGDGKPADGNVAAMAAVLGVTAVDVACARALSATKPVEEQPHRDYSDRSGFPLSPDEMRGAALANFRQPPDMQAPLPLQPGLAAGSH